MRDWRDYGLAEWTKGTPLIEGLKRARNVATKRLYRRLPARGYDRFMAELGALRPDVIAVSIAFNTPWVINVTTEVTRRKLAGTLIVCDNSKNPAARREIESICKDRGVPYLALPFNLEHHPCRSHGIAMNWVYYNVIDRLRPRVFGFLDHDLFPTERLDLAALVADQPVYGLRETLYNSVWGWNLWAGFCVFDRAAVADFLPDFNNDYPRQLDTGGRNWMQIYRHLDRSRIRFADGRSQEIYLPDDPQLATVYWVDSCLHVVAASYRDGKSSKTLEQLHRGLLRYIDAGGTVAELTEPPRQPQLT